MRKRPIAPRGAVRLLGVPDPLAMAAPQPTTEEARITQAVLGLREPPRLSEVGRLLVVRVLALVTPQEEQVLRMRCHHPLASIGKKFQTRSAQIEATALRKLRHPARSKYLEAACDSDLARTRMQEITGLVGPWGPVPTLWLPIDEIPLSSRAYRALDMRRVQYVWELVQLSRRELLLMRHVGPKTVDDIEDELAVLGFRLGMELERGSDCLDSFADGPSVMPDRVGR